jgi:hypothetical protein
MNARAWLACIVALALCACSGDPDSVERGGDARGGSGGKGGTTGLAGMGPGSGAAGAGGCGAGIGARQLRRLSRFEYDNSIADLLGLDAQAEEKFAADIVVNGFDDNAGALVVSPLLEQQLYETSERLAAEAVKDLGKLVPCDPAKGDAACAEKFIRDFGRRAFRRPVTDDEAKRYLDLHTLGSADGGFSAGIELTLIAMLQAPNFLYRTEIGKQMDDGTSVLEPYEIATELAYTLTGSTPDDMLLAAADAGQLATPDQIEAQAARLIETPRGHQQLARFVREWLELDRLASVPKDAQIFPEWNDQVRAAMAAEVDRFVEHVAYEDDDTLKTLLTTDAMFVNAELAPFYGVDMPAKLDDAGFGTFASKEPRRRGLLTLGAVMATHARPDSSSPVHRGKLVRERVLCQPLQPPPPGIVVQPPPVDPKLSVRERYAAHSKEQPCLGCHRLTDPIGFGFENFDGIGRYREQDASRPVDASGEIIASQETDGKFDGAAELSDALAQSPEVARCVALQWFRFAYGLAENDTLQCALTQMQDAFASSGGSLHELLLSTTRTDHFRARVAGPESTPEDVPQDPNLAADAGGAGAGAGDAGVPGVPDGLSVETRTDSSWAAGHCDTVTITNNTDAPVDWSVPVMLDGKLNDHWNSNVTGDSGTVTFTGADYNKTIPPGMSAQFGYCVAK